MSLVIKRKKGQTVRIGAAVVTILKATEGEVKLGIEAPDGVDIVRGELEETWIAKRTESIWFEARDGGNWIAVRKTIDGAQVVDTGKAVVPGESVTFTPADYFREKKDG